MSKTTPDPIDFSKPENSLGYLTRIAFRSISRDLERLTLPHGVTAGQWRFLRALWQRDGITQRELSRAVVMREPTTVIALKGMEKAGLVRRESCPDDRRRSLVFLTQRARDLQAELLPHIVAVNEQATIGMTDAEIAQLKVLLRRVCANLAENSDRE